MKYALGLDYGTQSGRALLLEIETGKEIAVAVHPYAHGVMDETLPNGTKLPPDWALQHPSDYLEVLQTVVPQVIAQGGVNPQDVIGIGIDFTACTLLPVDEQGVPLCLLPQWQDRPHAYIKLWKHHAAQAQADAINALAEKTNENWLPRYGGRISSEWLLPKIWQVLVEDEEIYNEANQFVEAGDWLVWQLTGNLTRNACMAGYKGNWHFQDGYPSHDFLATLDRRLENVFEEKVSGKIFDLGQKAGELTAEMAKKLGLCPGVAVAVANIDAHVTVPSVGMSKAGEMLMIMGTSTCHMTVGDKEVLVPGISGVVKGGILPGLMGYEAGQACVGDHFEWFAENCTPKSYHDEAAALGVDVQVLLTQKAQQLQIGQSGLVALDWWNGNRSVLTDASLSGLLIGCTLTTKPEEIYRALIEATAYGTRMIIETFEKNAVPVVRLFAAGGITWKNRLMMQIYADVTGKEIRIAKSQQAPALGSAMFGAVAAGKSVGGFDTIFEAAQKIGSIRDEIYRPIAENVKAYEALYTEYVALHDYFGRGANEVMKRLKKLRQDRM